MNKIQLCNVKVKFENIDSSEYDVSNVPIWLLISDVYV